MEKDKDLSIDIKHEAAMGSYSNMNIITSSRNEFIFDFGVNLPGLNKALITNRIIMTPETAKIFTQTLIDSINKYESMNGTIKINTPIKFPIGGTSGGNNTQS